MTCRIVAELSANHLGSLDRARAIIDAAARAGADAVKLQTFTPEQMANPEAIVEAGPWAGCNLVDLYTKAHVPRAWHGVLFQRIRDHGMEAFSSVFHPDDVDFLESLDCPRYKIASFELTDYALIAHAARTGKPLIISTGMALRHEIEQAVLCAFQAGCRDLTVLRCVSAYPSSPKDANLRTMQHLAHTVLAGLGIKVGLSDHSMGIGVAVAAAALGATMIEKHLTLARADGGPDAAFSMEPHEFAQMVVECRRAVEAVGGVRYGPSTAEEPHLRLRRAPGGKRAA